MYNSPKQKRVALKKWPLDANDVSLFKGYLKKITSEDGRRQTRIYYLLITRIRKGKSSIFNTKDLYDNL